MKEYGSNVQKLADYLAKIEETEKRTLYAHILVELMRQIHPNMRDGQDYSQKLWDDLYIMTGFKLDVQSPFPPPSPESVGKKPTQVPYTQKDFKYKQYGKNMLILIEKAINTENQEEKLAFISYLVRQMKTFYSVWNKDTPEDRVIFGQLEEMSGGRLREELAHLRQNGLVESIPRDKSNNQDRRSSTGQSKAFVRPNNNPRTGNDRSGNDRGNNRTNNGSDRSGNDRSGNDRNNNDRNRDKTNRVGGRDNNNRGNNNRNGNDRNGNERSGNDRSGNDRNGNDRNKNRRP